MGVNIDSALRNEDPVRLSNTIVHEMQGVGIQLDVDTNKLRKVYG